MLDLDMRPEPALLGVENRIIVTERLGPWNVGDEVSMTRNQLVEALQLYDETFPEEVHDA